jgi:hypothetical protein
MRGHEVEVEAIVEGENTQMSKDANRPGGGSDQLATAVKFIFGAGLGNIKGCNVEV